MLTSENFKDIRLKRVKFGGYKPEDVNLFIDDAILSISNLEKENSELLCKIKDLLQKNNSYKEEQESIRTTLIKAQKLADSSVEEAKFRSDEIINKAKFDANKILDEAKLKAEESLKSYEKDIKIQSDILSNLKKSVKEFRNNVLNLYKDHIKLVNSLTMDERLIEKVNKKIEKIQSDSEIKENKKEFLENSKITEKNIENIENNENNENIKNINKKFVNLKFGEDYDISKDETESSVGLFSKIQ